MVKNVSLLVKNIVNGLLVLVLLAMTVLSPTLAMAAVPIRSYPVRVDGDQQRLIHHDHVGQWRKLI